MLVATLASQAERPFVIDASETAITIRVGKAGLFGFAGHDHEITAPVVHGRIILDAEDVSRAHVAVDFDATALHVTGRGEPADDVPEVQRVMLSERVLDVHRYPTIAFRSRRIVVGRASSDGMPLEIEGDLTLHGVTRRVTVPATVTIASDHLVAEGTTTVRQTDFGIRPVTAAAGTVRVKDRVDITFRVAARRP